MTRDSGDPADRLHAADRARERAESAGERVAALRIRISELRTDAGASSTPTRSDATLASARERRDDAARRDREAHDSAANAHDRAADTFASFAETGHPTRKAGYLSRVDHHRRAALADRAHGANPDEPTPS